MSVFKNTIAKIFKRKKENALLERSYEGATTSQSIRWVTNTSLANSANQASLETLRNRARDMVRNNAFAESAVSKITSNIIGSGVLHEFKGEFEDEIWKKWAESKECDAEGILTYYGLQELIIRELVESGEVFIRKMSFGFDPQKRNIPLKLRLYSSEYLDMSKNGMFHDDNYISQGVEIDKLGRRVAYWMFPYHPENDLGWRQVSVRIPADEIIHVFKPKRAGQVRGVTWFAPVLIDLKMSDNYQSAELKRKEQNSSISGFITNHDDNTVTRKRDNTFYTKIVPGSIMELPSSTTLTLTNPQSDAHYDQYNVSVLRKIAVGLNMTYEALTGDLSRVNFSSGRMGLIEFNRQVESWRWNLTIPMFCEQVSKWFLESAELAGYDTSKITHVDYTAPHREMIDPVKETAAIVSSIRSGLKTHKEALKELGYNPQKFYEEIAEVNAILDEHKIILDSDPRHTTQQGLSQNCQNFAQNNTDSEKKTDKNAPQEDE